MTSDGESRHWTRTEQLLGCEHKRPAAAIVSIDVRRVLMAADYRRRHPGSKLKHRWDRLKSWWRENRTIKRLVVGLKTEA